MEANPGHRSIPITLYYITFSLLATNDVARSREEAENLYAGYQGCQRQSAEENSLTASRKQKHPGDPTDFLSPIHKTSCRSPLPVRKLGSMENGSPRTASSARGGLGPLGRRAVVLGRLGQVLGRPQRPIAPLKRAPFTPKYRQPTR